jgi:hypothetical protein
MRTAYLDCGPWLVVAFVALGGTGRAEPPAPCPQPGPEVKLDQPDPNHTPERAGYPWGVRKCAVPTNVPGYCGGYVGGGAPCGKGDAAGPGDGTWGWDYAGCLLSPRRVFLGWFHGRAKQPPGGPYATDGPPVPAVFSARPLARLRENRAETEAGCRPDR